MLFRSVAILQGFSAGDYLVADDTPGVNAFFDSGSGVLTLTGRASSSQYQVALRSVRFGSTSLDPTAHDQAPTRTIGIIVSDGVNAVDGANVTFVVESRNQAATFSGRDSATITEDSGNFEHSGVLTVTDVDSIESILPRSGVAGRYGMFGITANGGWQIGRAHV